MSQPLLEIKKMGTKETAGSTKCNCRILLGGQERNYGGTVPHSYIELCNIHEAGPELLEVVKRLQVKIFMDEGSENEEYQMAARAIDKIEGNRAQREDFLGHNKALGRGA